MSKLFYAHSLAKKYLTGHGSVVSFEIDASKEETSKFVDTLQVPYMGTSFGLQYSIVEQCSIFTYYKQSDAERQDLGITDNLIRLSLGYEDLSLIIDDMENAFSSLS
ncbi:MAG: PLP-dependent transferase [Pseudomonadota bacterium]